MHTILADGILLGIKSGSEYEECEVSLEPGDVLVLYTDGLTEAGVDKQRFGRGRIMDTLTAHASKSAQEIAEAIHDAVLDFVHGRVTDDVAMVVLKVTG